MISSALTAVLACLDRGEDIWESAISAGIDAQSSMDEGRWLIGDLARLVDKSYGDDRIGDFAKGINVDVKRVMEYRTVAKFWPISVRAELLEACPTVSYSHMRLAMQCGDLDKATAFIETCASEALTVESARLRLKEVTGKPSKPKKLGEFVDVTHYFSKRVALEKSFDCVLIPEGFPVEAGKRYRFVVYEVVGEDEENGISTALSSF